MRYLLPFLFLFVGCLGPNHSVSELLTPDEFHLSYAEGASEGTGNSYGQHAPWRRFSNSDAESETWMFGLTWNLTAPSGARGLREAARQMQISARLMADAAMAARTAPIPVQFHTAVPTASETTVVVVPSPTAQPAGPDINITVQGGEQLSTQEVTADPLPVLTDPVPDTSSPAVGGGNQEPQGVMLLGISSEVWTQLLVALGLLATAVAGYLGRHKIPVVKNMTTKGRAAKAAKEAEAREAPSEPVEPEEFAEP